MTGRKMCKNCDHAIWFDGEEWHHFAMQHDKNCKCKKPELKEKNARHNKIF